MLSFLFASIVLILVLVGWWSIDRVADERAAGERTITLVQAGSGLALFVAFPWWLAALAAGALALTSLTGALALGALVGYSAVGLHGGTAAPSAFHGSFISVILAYLAGTRARIEGHSFRGTALIFGGALTAGTLLSLML